MPRAQVEVCFDNRRRVIDLVTRLAFNIVSCKSNFYKKRLAANQTFNFNTARPVQSGW